MQDLGGASQDFADLARVVEKELDRGDRSREDAVLLKAVRAAREQAARAFAEALGSTFPGMRTLRSRTLGEVSR
jgi:hypothetical protein